MDTISMVNTTCSDNQNEANGSVGCKSDSLYEDYTTYDEHIAGIYLWKIVAPIMIIFGNFGNILCVIVLNGKSIRQYTISVFLTAMAISDTVALNTGLLRNWILYTFDKDIRLSSDILCRFHTWLLYFALSFSAWMLVAVTIVRAGLVCFPNKMKFLCTKQKALATIIIIAVVLSCSKLPILFGVGDIIEYDNGTMAIQHCVYLSKKYKLIFNNIGSWLDLVSFCVIPSVLLIVGNTIIIYTVIKSRQKVGATQQSTNDYRQRKPGSKSKISSMTTMLVGLNAVFLVSSIPISVYVIGYNQWYEEGDTRDLAVLGLMWPITNILMYSNNTFNFVLYILSGKLIRKEALKLLCCSKTNINADTELVANRQPEANGIHIARHNRILTNNMALQSVTRMSDIKIRNMRNLIQIGEIVRQQRIQMIDEMSQQKTDD
ncbi:Hypothetical predicted protein [Mytilus galloprovincialis]|uniref:G-protein coupled receptors family 1 profile domain-containing protein n=1 Tax=Mytilus galloprovincialis TaxID=29158 RepID=A0A8B6HB90_MYTGA|nr:Hypothetical predicted protein [Mytilus galloprovincialis]